jgi:hypothetical protein
MDRVRFVLPEVIEDVVGGCAVSPRGAASAPTKKRRETPQPLATIIV